MNQQIAKLLLWQGLLLLLPFVTFSQSKEKFTVSGVVLEMPAQEPMALIPILIEGTPTGVNTNLDGEFTFSLRPGTYVLMVKQLGYKIAR
ncbi:MAG: carboxypeptidase-like regulatory domain-containing protein, partial [Bacteroidia bacterium]|nr:carboxypeptidase-like regulatory domain-containing protein [Bacteroidia bacterium]